MEFIRGKFSEFAFKGRISASSSQGLLSYSPIKKRRYRAIVKQGFWG